MSLIARSRTGRSYIALVVLFVGWAGAFAAETTVALPERVRHLVQLGVDQWHQQGARGRGIKVAILDSGFRGYRDYCGTALPEQVTVRSFRKDGNLEAKDSQHGILCGEVVHALAPEAELLLANWEADNAESFLQAVCWARAQGAQVISCSVIMPSLSDGDGGGRVHAELARVLGPGSGRGDVLLFASSGNTAERHWMGDFHANADGFHEWAAGVVDNPVVPWGKERVSIELSCKADYRYELVVYDRDRGTVVAHSRPKGATDGCCVARFQPESGHQYDLRIRSIGSRTGPFHVVALHADLRSATAAGSVTFPADGPEVIAVGAVDAQGRRAAYSACGSDFCKGKPDLVAPVPFRSAWRPRPFGGTSAAAPQAAALAALLWSRHPLWLPAHVRASLLSAAHDLGTPGPDQETGFGVIHLPADK